MQRKRFTKKAFTLIELLIVIAIIGILFIVLVSKVDFATDKAKASGVQTDFRSFQMAFDTVAKENAGFNTFGWDTGDANQDGIRNSYDEGDNGAGGGIAKNGIQDGTEVFTGRKVYDETFTKVFSLKKNGTGAYDRDALNRLETAINANLDPKLHITIKDDGEIVMANGAKDPWNKEYHGWYITNAETDGQDRGAIVMYSDGANNEFGSEHSIANGVVKVIVPGSNKDGKDDYSIVSVYTYTNGYGEVQNITTGFSNNQLMSGNGVKPGADTPNLPNGGDEYEMLNGANQTVDGTEDVVLRSEADFDKFDHVEVDDVVVDESNYTVTEGSTIVTFKKEYLQTLTEGTHVVKIVSDDGAASANIYVEENVSIEQLSGGKFKMFDGSGMSFAIVNGGVELYNNNSVVATLPSEFVTIDNNVITITGADAYDGTYTIYEDGYVERDGQIVAKSEDMWVTYQDNNIDFFFIIHNDNIYISYDGNMLDEYYTSVSEVGAMINAFISDSAIYEGYTYQFEKYDGTFKVGTVFDALAAQTLVDRAWFQWTFMGVYEYWGGTAYDTKEVDSLMTHGHWDATNIDSMEKTMLYSINNSTKTKLNTSDILGNGVYVMEETVTYYHDGNIATNVMIFDDYPLYFETGMTYREWLHKYGCRVAYDTWSGYGDYYYYYVEEQYLDRLCEAGYDNKIRGGSVTGFMRSDEVGFTGSDGYFMPEYFFYSYGLMELKTFEAPEGYVFTGWTWAGGIVELGDKLYADEVFNYFIRNNLTIPNYISFEPIFEPID